MRPPPDASELERLRRREASRLVGLRAVGAALCLMAPVAAIILIALTLVRANFGVDPLLGIQGYALCPMRCDGCQGPWDVETGWHVSDTTDRRGRRGFENNGAFYYCQPPPSAARDAYDVGFAATGSTYLVGLFFAALLVPPIAWFLHRSETARGARANARIHALQAQLGHPPAPPARRAARLLGAGFVLILTTSSCALGVVLLQSLLW